MAAENDNVAAHWGQSLAVVLRPAATWSFFDDQGSIVVAYRTPS